ncbi:hypothetical protein [Priestia megaterium]|uniref:hypothetical protein n=1 Tax=Priestia megaterium TaxID=1404 RepID=UPI001DA159C8|nr:hypothetical protein [Priestia megaterium]CAH0318864.1 hypothetical protein SRABI82_05341 [Priestia megaterium]
MNIINKSRYIKDQQLEERSYLFSKEVRESDLYIYILKDDEGFKDLPLHMDVPKHFYSKIQRTIERSYSEAFCLYPENMIFLIEERLLQHSSDWNEFYANIAFLLSHELRHFQQSYFLEDRIFIMLQDYIPNYVGELLRGQIDCDGLHWSEQDAYTYSLWFVTKHKEDIIKIFQLDDWLFFFGCYIEVNYEKEWKRYKRTLTFVDQVIWTIKDLF